MLLPVGVSRPSDGLRKRMALAQASRLAAGRGEASQLAVLHHCATHPVDLGVTTDRVVARVNHDHFIELVRRVLGHPVAVEHAKRRDLAASSLLEQEYTSQNTVKAINKFMARHKIYYFSPQQRTAANAGT